MPPKQVYKITYPNGKIYVGSDLTGTVTYFGSPTAQERIRADLDEHLHDLTARKQILWESETATKAETLAMEIKLIRGPARTTLRSATTSLRSGAKSLPD